MAAGLWWADGVAGLLVTAFIVHVGWEVNPFGVTVIGSDPITASVPALRDGPLELSAIPVLPMGNVTITPFDAEPFLMVGRLWESSSSS